MARRRNSAAAQVERAERAAQAVELRRDGHTYRQIGTTLGCSHEAARTLVIEALAAIPADNVNLMRAIENERLNAIHTAFATLAETGDHRAAEVVIRASARRSALNGLDAPMKVEADSEVTIWMSDALMPSRLREPGQAFEIPGVRFYNNDDRPSVKPQPLTLEP